MGRSTAPNPDSSPRSRAPPPRWKGPPRARQSPLARTSDLSSFCLADPFLDLVLDDAESRALERAKEKRNVEIHLDVAGRHVHVPPERHSLHRECDLATPIVLPV